MLDIPGLNKANYNNCVIWNAATGNVSAVGLNGSPSYYGTYDQGGNVSEWIENNVSFSGYNPEYNYTSSKITLGGSFSTNSGTISKYDTSNNVGIHNQNSYNSYTLKKDIGFRVFSSNNPLNLPNFVTVTGSSASETLPQSRLYGITEENIFFEVIPERRACSLVFGTGTTFQKSPCNALAYNFDKDQIYFTFDGYQSDPSGLYWWNTNSTNPQLAYIASSNTYLTTSIGNADYYASGYWYFTEGTKTLNKILFSYAGSSNVPTATGKQTWNISLPILDTDNRLGDIAIDKNSGMLYASTASNTFYAINLLPTTTGGSPVFIKNAQLSGPGSSPAILQLAMNYNGSILYGHHRDRKEWYIIDKDIYSEYFGKISVLKTVDNSSNFLTPGFRDISGNYPFTIRSINSNFKASALEVTNQQYVDFLNNVDPDGLLADESDYNNSYGQLASRSSGLLYHSIMSNTTYGGIGFDYNDVAGSKYAVLQNMENKPVNYVSAFMAMRYCNWLHNRVDNANTKIIDTGAYDFVSNPFIDMDGIQFDITRSSNARYYLPSRREWYKAAYYSDNLNDVQKWSYTNGNPFEDSATLPVQNLEGLLPVTTGWKILTNGTWSTVTTINYDDPITTNITISPGIFNMSTNGFENPGVFDFYSMIPSGFYNYATQSNNAPSCSDIDPYGNGPTPQNVGHLVTFTNLIPGNKYVAYFTLSEESPYTATIDKPIVAFIASSTTEQIMVQITKYWPMKMLVLTSKLMNGSDIIVSGSQAVQDGINGIYYLSTTTDSNGNDFYSKDGKNSYPRIGLTTLVAYPYTTYWAFQKSTVGGEDFLYYIMNPAYPDPPISNTWLDGDYTNTLGIISSSTPLPRVFYQNNTVVKCDSLSNDCEIGATRLPMVTRTVTKTPYPTRTVTPTVTKTITPTITVTPTITSTTTPTTTITPTNTPTPSITPTLTPTPTITITTTPTITPTITVTPTETVTPTVTSTVTPTITVTPTNTQTPTVTPTITVSPSFTPTNTPTATSTATVTPTMTISPSTANDRLLSGATNGPSNFVMESYEDSALLTWKTPLDTTLDSLPLYGYSYGVYLGNNSNSSISDSAFQWASYDLPASSAAALNNYTYSWPVDMSVYRYQNGGSITKPIYIRLFSKYINNNFGSNTDPRTVSSMINAGWYRWNPNNNTANPCAPNILSATGGDLQATITWSHPTQILLVPGISRTLYNYIVAIYVSSTNAFFNSRQIPATETSYTFGATFQVPQNTYKVRVYAMYSSINISGGNPAAYSTNYILAPSQTAIVAVTNNF